MYRLGGTIDWLTGATLLNMKLLRAMDNFIWGGGDGSLNVSIKQRRGDGDLCMLYEHLNIYIKY